MGFSIFSYISIHSKKNGHTTLNASKINGFKHLGFYNTLFSSLSISVYIRSKKCHFALINHREINSFASVTWWFLFFGFTLYHIRKISICSETLINPRKIKGSIFRNKSNKSKIFFFHIRDEFYVLKTLKNGRFTQFY